MAISNISTAARSAMADAFVDQLDVGSTDTCGDMQIQASDNTVLAEVEFSATAFGAAASGVATAAAISDDTSADATGTAAIIRFRDQDNATVADGTAGSTGSGEDLELSDTSITAGDTVSVTSFTVTMPAS